MSAEFPVWYASHLPVHYIALIAAGDVAVEQSDVALTLELARCLVEVLADCDSLATKLDKLCVKTFCAVAANP